MNSLNRPATVKRALGVIGAFAAGVAIVLPVAAQGKPQSETLPPNTVAPAPNNAADVAPSPNDAGRASEVPTPVNPVNPVNPGAAMQSPPPVNSGQSTPAPSANSNSSTTTPAPSVATTSGTIADIASASSSFQTLFKALNETELTQVLQGQGPFTVFAPTDEAFAALPAGTVDELLKPENRAALIQLLKYHVVAGAYPSSSLAAGQIPTEAGGSVTVSVNNGQVMVNDAHVIQPDITATNGVIHAIDRVMLPPTR